MNRITVGLATAALGMFLLAPCAKAQSWQDMHNDQEAIEHGHRHLHHDRQELRNDLRNGDYEAAEHERAEMNRRRAAIGARQEDLNNDMATRYYGDNDDAYGHHYRHHHDDDDR
jgi:UPF0716 family protein affecting phage T7 exclusion